MNDRILAEIAAKALVEVIVKCLQKGEWLVEISHLADQGGLFLAHLERGNEKHFVTSNNFYGLVKVLLAIAPQELLWLIAPAGEAKLPGE